MSVHPTDLELFDFVEGGPGAARSPELIHHLRTCTACQAQQARHMQAAYQLSDTLGRMANTIPFSPTRSWARLAPCLQQARRNEHLALILRLAASALVTLLLVAGMIRLAGLIRPQTLVVPDATPLPAIAPTTLPPTVTSIVPLPSVAKLPSGRITVLIAGMDRRSGEAGPGLTDLLMLFSLDRAQHTAVVLSIPRDLWVEISGYGPGRINSAYALGEKSSLGSGATLLKQTAGAALGVRVDHVVRIEFGAVVTLIDAIGGVDIDVPSVINDPLFPDSGNGYDPLFIPAGRQRMDGTLALKYMRTRHGSNDFARSARQQQVLTAVRQKVTQPSVWPDFIGRVPNLVAQLKGTLATDLSVTDMLDLAQQARDVPDGSLRTAVLDGRYVVDYVTPEGAQVLLPLKDRVSAFVADLLATGQAPITPEAEMARIRVMNGTPQTGLAARTADWLRKHGFNVASAENADRFTYEKTLLIDHSGRPATVKALADLFKITSGNLVYRPEPAAPAEIDLVLGADFVLPAP